MATPAISETPFSFHQRLSASSCSSSVLSSATGGLLVGFRWAQATGRRRDDQVFREVSRSTSTPASSSWRRLCCSRSSRRNLSVTVPWASSSSPSSSASRAPLLSAFLMRLLKLPPPQCSWARSSGSSPRRRSRSEEHTSELQSRPHLVCRLLLEKKKKKRRIRTTNSHKQEIIKTRNQLGTRQNEKIAIINQY